MGTKDTTTTYFSITIMNDNNTINSQFNKHASQCYSMYYSMNISKSLTKLYIPIFEEIEHCQYYLILSSRQTSGVCFFVKASLRDQSTRLWLLRRIRSLNDSSKVFIRSSTRSGIIQENITVKKHRCNDCNFITIMNPFLTPF